MEELVSGGRDALVAYNSLRAYLRRAEDVMASLPEETGLTHVRRLDIEERVEWGIAMESSRRSLGYIVQEVYHRRNHQWRELGPRYLAHSSEAERPSRATRKKLRAKLLRPCRQKRSARQDGETQSAAAQPKADDRQGKKVKFCQLYNEGRCPYNASMCRQGRHQCSKLLGDGSVCGARCHAAANCNARSRKASAGKGQTKRRRGRCGAVTS